MGHKISKIGIFIITVWGISCSHQKSTPQEYIYFTYEQGTPQRYKIVMTYQQGNTIRQIWYSGKLSRIYDDFKQQIYPDTSEFGTCQHGSYSYRRIGNFSRIKFDVDTVSSCSCFDFAIPLKNSVVQTKSFETESPFVCVTLVGMGKDTLFNKKVSVKHYKRYSIYECHDVANNNGTYDLWIDADTKLLAQFSYTATSYGYDEYPFTTSIEDVKPISSDFFESIWDNATDENLSCSPIY